MHELNNENPVFFDVDETLVLAPTADTGKMHLKEIALVADPINPNETIIRLKHHAMIRLLKEEFSKGSYVIVWSRGGKDWAKAVVKALNLQDYVNLVMTKPMVYFDDLPIEQWLPYRVYIKPGTIYK